MKRCEREMDAETAAGIQAMVRRLCGRCVCETGEQCPLFSYKRSEVGATSDDREPCDAIA